MFARHRQHVDNGYRITAAVVFGMATLLFFARLGERALWSEEVRWAEIPREMERSGDYWWPTFNGRVYYDKPLGSYWLVLAAGRLTGGVNELAARLPSAASGLAAVMFTMLLARRLYGRRTAVLGGAILATSFGFTNFARTASADAETVAGVTAALWLFVRHDGRPGRWLVLFWLMMALTSLTKGLLGFALPLLVAGVYSMWTGIADVDDGNWIMRSIRANRWLLNRTTLVAAPLAVAIYTCPFLMSQRPGGATEGLAMVYRENVRRFFDPVNHRGPVYLYAVVIFALFAPWSLLLPTAIMRAHRRMSVSRPRGNRFALSFFWVVFLFFTLSSSRRSYYLLPVLPAASLLVAAAVARPGPSLRRFLKAIPPRRVRVATVVCVFALQAIVFLVAQPATEGYRTQRLFAETVRDKLGPELAAVAFFRTSEIAYYLDAARPLPEYHNIGDVRRAAESGQVGHVIVRRRDRNALGPLWTEEAAEARNAWDGPDQSATKLLLLRNCGARPAALD
jgi:4-amino-4-deoxy-L-arabinose transferase-like glycosyltransferase